MKLAGVLATVALLVLGLFAPGTRAQIAVELPPSPLVDCLAMTPGAPRKPTYPEHLFERKDGGRVVVKLSFAGPTDAPEIEFERGPGLSELSELRAAVRDFVREFRMPCMPSEGPVATVRQTYDFVPNDGRQVYWRRPTDLDEQRLMQLRCLRPGKGPLPKYPIEARKADWQGTVVARLRFASPQDSPEVTVLANPGGPRFRGELDREVIEYAQTYRMPCFRGAPLDAVVFFLFKLDGGSRVVLRDVTLVDFLAVTRDIDKANVYFDTTQMSCPFDLRVVPRMPFASNMVMEVEGSNPARQPLVEWLSQRTLNLPEHQANRVLMQSMTVTVPCIVLRLNSDAAGGPGGT